MYSINLVINFNNNNNKKRPKKAKKIFTTSLSENIPLLLYKPNPRGKNENTVEMLVRLIDRTP
jgi:hypothetical protein